MNCPECKTGRMRTTGNDKRGKDPLGIYRYRKCNSCDYSMETREVFDIMVSADISKLYRCLADVCPGCLSETIVVRTVPAYPGVVFRSRVCTKCGISYETRESVHKIGVLVVGVNQ